MVAFIEARRAGPGARAAGLPRRPWCRAELLAPAAAAHAARLPDLRGAHEGGHGGARPRARPARPLVRGAGVLQGPARHRDRRRRGDPLAGLRRPARLRAGAGLRDRPAGQGHRGRGRARPRLRLDALERPLGARHPGPRAAAGHGARQGQGLGRRQRARAPAWSRPTRSTAPTSSSSCASTARSARARGARRCTTTWGALIAYASQALHPASRARCSARAPCRAAPGSSPGRFLAPGDVVELEGAGIGVLSQPDRPAALSVIPRHAALALLGLAIAAFALRPQIVGVGPILERMRDDLGMSHGVAGLLSTIPVLCMGIFAPPAAYLAARVGAARAVTVSLLLIGSFGLLRAGAPGALLVIAADDPDRHRHGHGQRADAGRREGALLRQRRCAPRRSTPSASSSGPRSRRRSRCRWPTSATGPTAGASRSPSTASRRFVCLVVWLAMGRREPAAPPRERAAAPPRLPWRCWAPGCWPCSSCWSRSSSTPSPRGCRTCWWRPAGARAVGRRRAGVLNACTVSSTLFVGTVGAPGALAPRADRARRRVPAGVGTLGVAVAPGGGWLWAAACGSGIGMLFPMMMNLPIDMADRPEAVGAVAGLMLLRRLRRRGARCRLALGALRDCTGSYAATTWALSGFAVAALTVGEPAHARAAGTAAFRDAERVPPA